eukprot:1122889-Pyramimonas_sp.AAC.1
MNVQLASAAAESTDPEHPPPLGALSAAAGVVMAIPIGTCPQKVLYSSLGPLGPLPCSSDEAGPP